MKAASLWPAAIVGVLGLTVVANAALLYEASRGHAAIEPDYYRKAITWDSTMAQARHNVALGWRLDGRLDPDGTLVVTLTDQRLGPLDGATVEVEGFALARGELVYRATLSPSQTGDYRGKLALPQGGLQELRFTVTRAGDQFTAVLRGSPGERLIPRA